tara:strand:+ start:31 stop:264 length:234 start_codon:yes stop_codon:yes gene_type:complete
MTWKDILKEHDWKKEFSDNQLIPNVPIDLAFEIIEALAESEQITDTHDYRLDAWHSMIPNNHKKAVKLLEQIKESLR